MSNINPSFVSLFAGAGGLDLGLEQAGWRCLYASDVDHASVASLERNRGFSLGRGRRVLADAYIEQADVRNLSAREVLAKAGVAKGDIPLLAGGPPCQSWSSAGHQHGFADPRGRLFDDFIRLAEGLGTRWVLLENVRGLATARGPDGAPGSALSYIRKRLLDGGFQTVVGLLNAADYGAPQRRVRLFMFGFRAGDPPPFPAATHSRLIDLGEGGKKPWVTLKQALATIPAPAEDEVLRPNPALSRQLREIEPGQGVKSPGKPEATRPGGHWGYKQGAFVADLEQPARTVTANGQQDWIKDPVIGLRRLSPRECAALQTFPAGWIFDGGRGVQYRLVGNAVPPVLARAIGAALLKHLKRQGDSPEKTRFDKASLLPLPERIVAAIDYTARDERANGASRRASPNRRVSRILERRAARL